jgi:hypothetical protein
MLIRFCLAPLEKRCTPLQRRCGVSVEEAPANSLVPAQRFVAGNAGFIPRRFSHHVFDSAFFQVHQVARSENTGVAHSSANMDLAVSKDLAAWTHRFIMPQGVIAEDLAAAVQWHLDRSQVLRIVQQAARRAKIQRKVSPHWFRHAHASHAMDRGAGIHLVCATLARSSIVIRTPSQLKALRSSWLCDETTI